MPWDEDHDGQRFTFRRFWCDDVEREAVFAHRLVLANPEDRVAPFLRRALGKAVAIPHTSPWLGRLRSPKAQRTTRRPGVRDGSPAVAAVAGKAFDGAGGRGHA